MCVGHSDRHVVSGKHNRCGGQGRLRSLERLWWTEWCDTCSRRLSLHVRRYLLTYRHTLRVQYQHLSMVRPLPTSVIVSHPWGHILKCWIMLIWTGQEIEVRSFLCAIYQSEQYNRKSVICSFFNRIISVDIASIFVSKKDITTYIIFPVYDIFYAFLLLWVSEKFPSHENFTSSLPHYEIFARSGSLHLAPINAPHVFWTWHLDSDSFQNSLTSSLQHSTQYMQVM